MFICQLYDWFVWLHVSYLFSYVHEGKTKTLMAAIVDVLGLLPSNDDKKLRNNRVLVCAPSHAAADVITGRLISFLAKEAIFRLYDKSRPLNTVPSSIIHLTCQNTSTGEFTLPPPSGTNNSCTFNLSLFATNHLTIVSIVVLS